MLRLLGLGSLFLMSLALYFEHVMNLEPCTMCIWQRIPHIFVIALGILAALPLLETWRPPMTALTALTLTAGAGIALWHSGVELKLLPGPSSCSAALSLGDGDDAADLLNRILAAPQVRCDEVPWSFLGLSMANWNGIISAVMAVAAGYCFLGPVSRKTGKTRLAKTD
jgi:disulfide bond formation protein DsbB